MPSEPPPTTWTLARPPATIRTTSGRSEPTSSRARCSPPTGSGSSRCRSRATSSGGRRERAGGDPASTASAPSRSLRRAARGYEIRVDTAFAEVIRGCADPRRPHGWIDERLRRRLHAAARARLGALGRGVGRRGARGRALRRRDRRPLRGRVEVLPAQRARRRRRCSGSSSCSRRPAASGSSTCSGRRRTSLSLGAVEVPRAEYHRLLDAALAAARTRSSRRRLKPAATAQPSPAAVARTAGRCRS